MGPPAADLEFVVPQTRSTVPGWSLPKETNARAAPPSKGAAANGQSMPRLLGSAGPSVTGACQKLLLGGCYPAAANCATHGLLHLAQTPMREEEPQDKKVRYQFNRLEQLELLGSGSFGSVTLVKCHTTDQVLALKAVSKGMVVKKKMEQKVKNEKRVMQRCQSPFVVKLAACFNRDEHLYFLMEAAMGGDLWTLFDKNEFYGSNEHARFYVACVASGLDHLHKQHVMYRDLKLENVVLDGRGYAKLCDFGLATFLKSTDPLTDMLDPASLRAYTTCGTPAYMAPEIISMAGYSFAADWWALGVLTFEMQTGRTPFDASNAKETIKKVKQGIAKVKFPERADWPELVKGLCNHDPHERLPLRPGGFSNLENLAWFRKGHFDWEAHRECQLQPPYVPILKDATDTSNFDPHASEKPRAIAYKDPGNGWDQDFEDAVGPRHASRGTKKVIDQGWACM